ncbi:DNA (cytosine-5)-methyltransferase, putative [Plasmodium vivax]|uniref:DNA (Cytosine-5)-methyltransferase, putative n=1 Tax=Plasmodium vivax TaxID=5855 RepID=A0A1G4GRG8_PLAVI|nr:DNA (cytosine-5)-methyltransferase, putative [Plasmodium vivax]
MGKIKVLDLYSGIGGLHYSMLQALINCVHERAEKGTLKGEAAKGEATKGEATKGDAATGEAAKGEAATGEAATGDAPNCANLFSEAVRFISIDLNCFANQTHHHNFEGSSIYLTEKKYIDRFFKEYQGEHSGGRSNAKEAPFVQDKNYILQTDINNLDAHFLDYHKFFILLISNPCQPYTRQNKKFQQVNLDELFGKYASHTAEESPLGGGKKQNGSSPSPLEKSDRMNNLLTRSCAANESSDADDKAHLVTPKCNDLGDVPLKGTNKSDHDRALWENHRGGEDPFHVGRLNLDEALNFLQIEKDERSRSFFHICNLLKKVKEENLPKYIFIENVRNFELSSSFLYFINSVKKNYNFQTYLLSPLQYGIPNERLRFYCICRRKDKSVGLTSWESFPNGGTAPLYSNSLMPAKCILRTFENNPNFRPSPKYSFYTPSLATFLDHNDKYPIMCNTSEGINLTNETLQEYEVKNSTLEKCSSFCFDMIDINRNGNVCCFDGGSYFGQKSEAIRDLPHERNLRDLINSNKVHSMCFTSNYARYINGSGSVLYFSGRTRGSPSFGREMRCGHAQSGRMEKAHMGDQPLSGGSCSDNVSHDDSPREPHRGEIIKQMSKYKNRARYFTPVEICRLMGYKMRTGRAIREGGEGKKNRVGNIYWNMDHIHHMCAYTCGVHYCASGHSDRCLFNEGLHLAEHQLRRSPTDGVLLGGESPHGKSHHGKFHHGKFHHGKSHHGNPPQDERTTPCSCHEFKFPPFLTNRQKYKLVGNSVNVTVIALIFQAHDIFGDLLKGGGFPS